MTSPALFLSHVQDQCRATGITLILSPTETVFTIGDGCTVAGFFDDRHKILSVAVARADWLQNLAHEFSHLEQFCSGKFLTAGFGDTEPYSLIDRWLAGETFPNDEVDRAFDFAIECELDAERRAVGHLTQFNLGGDHSEYMAEANGYALTYKYAQTMRHWPKPKSWVGSPLVPSDRIVAKHELICAPKVIEFLYGKKRRRPRVAAE